MPPRPTSAPDSSCPRDPLVLSREANVGEEADQGAHRTKGEYVRAARRDPRLWRKQGGGGRGAYLSRASNYWRGCLARILAVSPRGWRETRLEWCSGERRKGIWALQVSTDVYGENRGCEGGIGARKEEGIHVPRRTTRGQGDASTRGRVDVGGEMRKTLASRFSLAARERINGEAAIGVLIPPFPPRN
jgi:hypothetical protein